MGHREIHPGKITMTLQSLATEHEQTSNVNPPLAESQRGQHLPKVTQTSRGGHWISVVSHLDARYGGLSAVVPRLASAIADTTDFRVGLAAFCAPDEVYSFADHRELPITKWPASRLAWLTDRRLIRDFRDSIRDADGIHIHGLWEQSTRAATQAARALRKPYVLSAHGMLETWALKNKRIKKTIYAALTERKNINGAACLHALTHAEAEDYRRFGSRCPIAIIPNGVAIAQNANSELFLRKYPSLREKRVVLFLIEAWATIAEKWPEARLVLAGPDFEGTRSKIEALAAERGLNERVLFTGMLRDEMKWSALAAAQCFVLPSHSEGLSVSVLEAMGVGLPVIITEQCNLPQVATYEAGWIVKPDLHQIAASLNEFLQNSPSTNQQIGNRGRLLVGEQYNWPLIARKMSEVYQWVQGGPVPASVDLLRN
jgi:glycosyltransferase involved in cell wall biosynthesis